MNTLIARFQVPGTTALISIEKREAQPGIADLFYVKCEAPFELGGFGEWGRDTEEEARKTANSVWSYVVELRKRNEAANQQIPGLSGVTVRQAELAFGDHNADKAAYRDDRRDANVAAATGTINPRYAGVRQAREEARTILTALVPDHDKFRVAVQLPGDKLRFFQLDAPLKGRWVGCLFMKEQASDETYKVRDIVREEAVLREVIKDAEGALIRYGLELEHCGLCGRTLTDEESRARGIGPVCIDKL